MTTTRSLSFCHGIGWRLKYFSAIPPACNIHSSYIQGYIQAISKTGYIQAISKTGYIQTISKTGYIQAISKIPFCGRLRLHSGERWQQAGRGRAGRQAAGRGVPGAGGQAGAVSLLRRYAVCDSVVGRWVAAEGFTEEWWGLTDDSGPVALWHVRRPMSRPCTRPGSNY